jgi:methionyl-tRNA formyltransferase
MNDTLRIDKESSDKLRILLMRGNDPHNVYLEQLLSSEFDVVRVVVEPQKAQGRRLLRERKYRDYLAFQYHAVRRLVFGYTKFRREFFKRLTEGDPANLESIECNWINAASVARDIRGHGADICVVSCISIMSKKLIDEVGVPILNIHGGYLPDYRGCHCFFFAVLEGRLDRIGSTIHVVESGIDTGPVLKVAVPAVDYGDNPEKLYCKAEKLASEMLVRELKQLESGAKLTIRKQNFRGRLVLRRDRTIYHELKYHIYRLLGRIQLRK